MVSVVDSEWDGPSRQALTLPAGISRDALVGVLVDRVPPDGQLAAAETLHDGAGIVLRWAHLEAAPPAG